MISTVLNQWLELISSAITSNVWFAPLLALFAGVLTSVTPCALTSVPLVIGYVGATGHNDTKRAFRLSAVFAVGMSVTFTVLGTAAALLGRLMQSAGSWWYLILGVLMLLMALQLWEIFDFIPATSVLSKNPKRGFLGAFLAGILGGFFSSPCATPVLVVLLALVAKEGSLIVGVLLLLLYSIGHSVLVMLAGTSIGLVQKLLANEKYSRLTRGLKIIMGVIVLLISFYMFYLGF